MKNLLKLVAINLLAYFITYLYTLVTEDVASLTYYSPEFKEIAIGKLFVCTASLLILAILFNVKNTALNIYFFYSILLCFVLAKNAPSVYFNFHLDSIYYILSTTCIFTFPCSVFLEYAMGVNGLADYVCLIMIPYFSILSILHYISIRFTDKIKAKLQK